MAKFTITLFDIGDHVKIVGGDFDGLTGKVVEWGHISGAEPFPIHYIMLDQPVNQSVEKRTDAGGGRIMVEQENVVFTKVEIPSTKIVSVV